MGGHPGTGLGQHGVVSVVGQFDGLLPDGPVGQDHHHQAESVPESDELHRPHDGGLVGRADHHGGAVRQVGEQARGALEHQLDLPVGVIEELSHLLAAARVEGARCAEVVDEEAVALVGRDAAGTRVRLDQEAVPLEGGHVGSHGRRRHAHAGSVDHVLGPHGLGSPDVLGDHGREDRRLAGVEVRVGLRRVLVSAVVDGRHGAHQGEFVHGRAPTGHPVWSGLALHSSEC